MFFVVFLLWALFVGSAAFLGYLANGNMQPIAAKYESLIKQGAIVLFVASMTTTLLGFLYLFAHAIAKAMVN